MFCFSLELNWLNPKPFTMFVVICVTVGDLTVKLASGFRGPNEILPLGHLSALSELLFIRDLEAVFRLSSTCGS